MGKQEGKNPYSVCIYRNTQYCFKHLCKKRKILAKVLETPQFLGAGNWIVIPFVIFLFFFYLNLLSPASVSDVLT